MKPSHRFLFVILLPLTFLTASTVALFAPNVVNGQGAPAAADTLWGNGIFSTKDISNNNPVPNVNLFLTPQNMETIIPDTTYEFTTDINAVAEFNLPVYIDTIVNVQELIKNQTRVLPTFGSEINVFFPSMEKGVIELYNMAGQKVKEQEFSAEHTYLQLQDLKTGVYVYAIKTANGESLGGKFVKQNVPLNGPASRPTNNTSLEKEIFSTTATYWARWEKEGYYTDSVLVDIEEGNNGFVKFYMTSTAIVLPQHQDISGVVTDMNNNFAPLSGVTVLLKNMTTGINDTVITGSDGSFIFEDQPLETSFWFSAGNVSGKYSFKNITYTTPVHINVASDTINNNFSVVLPDILSSTTAQHIKDQTKNGTQQDPVYFYLGNSFTPTQKTTIRGYFNQLEIDENNVFNYVESTVPLVNTGINIEYGTYNTQAYPETVITPIGVLEPVLYANSTMGTSAGYDSFVHEIKRAIGLDEVAWPGVNSVMETPVQEYTQEDKDIGVLERTYWNSVYQTNHTWIDLDYVSDYW